MDPPALHLMLSNVPLLAHMAEADRERITSQLQSTHFAEGECIISEGTLGESLMIVAEGVAVAEIKGEEVMRYVAGDYFGELSLLTGAPRQATVRAVGGSCQCLLLQREQFDAGVQRRNVAGAPREVRDCQRTADCTVLRHIVV